MKKILILFTLLASIVVNAQTYTKANYGFAITDLDKKTNCVSVVTCEVDSSSMNIICVYVPSGEIIYQMHIDIMDEEGYVSSDSVFVHAYRCDVVISSRNSAVRTISDVLIMYKYSNVSKSIDVIIHNTSNKVLFRFNYLPKFI